MQVQCKYITYYATAKPEINMRVGITFKHFVTRLLKLVYLRLSPTTRNTCVLSDV